MQLTWFLLHMSPAMVGWVVHMHNLKYVSIAKVLAKPGPHVLGSVAVRQPNQSFPPVFTPMLD